MAFTTIESVTETSFATDTSAHAVNFPASTSAGDLLLLLWANDGSALPTTPAGWTELANSTYGSQVSGLIAALVATGSEGGTTVDVVTALPEAGAAQIYRMAGSTWGGTIATDIDISTVAVGSGSAPNSDNVVAGWGSDDNTFISLAMSGDDDDAANGAPGTYTDLTSTLCGAGSNASGRVHSARKQDTPLSSHDAAAFSLEGIERWMAYALVIKPGAASSVPIGAIMHHRKMLGMT